MSLEDITILLVTHLKARGVNQIPVHVSIRAESSYSCEPVLLFDFAAMLGAKTRVALALVSTRQTPGSIMRARNQLSDYRRVKRRTSIFHIRIPGNQASNYSMSGRRGSGRPWS